MVRGVSLWSKGCRFNPSTDRIYVGGESQGSYWPHLCSTAEGPWARPLTPVAPVQPRMWPQIRLLHWASVWNCIKTESDICKLDPNHMARWFKKWFKSDLCLQSRRSAWSNQTLEHLLHHFMDTGCLNGVSSRTRRGTRWPQSLTNVPRRVQKVAHHLSSSNFPRKTYSQQSLLCVRRKSLSAQ